MERADVIKEWSSEIELPLGGEGRETEKETDMCKYWRIFNINVLVLEAYLSKKKETKILNTKLAGRSAGVISAFLS